MANKALTTRQKPVFRTTSAVKPTKPVAKTGYVPGPKSRKQTPASKKP